MPTPFPGMDPYLEHPALWPDVHNSLIAAIRDEMAARVAPRYYIGLEQRAYLVMPDDHRLVGVADLAVIPRDPIRRRAASGRAEPGLGVGVLDVEVPMAEAVHETFLELREVATGRLVTVIEVMSPANKLSGAGREDYEQKRQEVFYTRTNLVEIDLLRAGEPLPVIGEPVRSDYRILISRGAWRPHAQLYPFGLRQPIPEFPLPLLPGEAEPPVDLGAVLHALYDRARFDLRLDYARPPVPPLDEVDAAWARGLLGA